MNGWPVSYACCAPVEAPKASYCADHAGKFFNLPTLTEAKLAKSLRKHT